MVAVATGVRAIDPRACLPASKLVSAHGRSSADLNGGRVKGNPGNDLAPLPGLPNGRPQGEGFISEHLTQHTVTRLFGDVNWL